MTPEMTRNYSAHATLEDKRRGLEQMPDFLTAPHPTALIEEDAERAALLRKFKALPTAELKRLLSLAE